MRVHLIANSHLDPVWLWDWREGMTEAICTVRAVVDLMEENPRLTYIRGESALYRHIEAHEPELFQRILRHVESGRWDFVGGTYIQPDTNLAGVEVLARHFTEGQRYFQGRFGRRATVAWQADSFGHSAGLPDVLAAAGIDSFAFTRPDKKAFPIASPAFWWKGQSGARILCYRPLIGWYGTERDEMPRRLDGLLDAAHKSSLKTVACFFGLGNHGGGPSRRHLLEIQAWAETHPEVNVTYSTLHGFFAALRQEIDQRHKNDLPVHSGELNFCLRGCYSSQARFKALYRRGEGLLARAERTQTLVSSHLGAAAPGLGEAWRGLLFNSFHDILPGSSIERATEDQTQWMGGVLHAGQVAEFESLARLARQIDTTSGPRPEHHPAATSALVWNPQAQPFTGHVELEACLDYRPLWKYENRPEEVPIRVLGAAGKPLPFQEIALESRVIAHVPWRKRVLVPVTVPAFGWNVIELGWMEGALPPKVKNPVRATYNWIDNGQYRVKAVAGKRAVQMYHLGKALFKGEGMKVEVVRDPWGSWGGMTEEYESIYLNDVVEEWKISEVELLEHGSERCALWVRMAGARSHIDFTFSVMRDRPAIDIAARVFWADRSSRLKLRFPVGDEAEFEVPGATVKRGPCGEVPGGRWVFANARFGFASDSIYNFDTQQGVLSATVVRSTRYADEMAESPESKPWMAATDLGELKFRALITTEGKRLPQLARELEQPPVVLIVPQGPGPLGRAGSLAELEPAGLQLLAIKPAEAGHGVVLRVQGAFDKIVKAKLKWLGNTFALGKVEKGQIASWLLEPRGSTWKVTPVDLSESPLSK